MDDSSVFRAMLYKAIAGEPGAFAGFDCTKNVQDQLQEMMVDLYKRVKVREIGKEERAYVMPPRALLEYFYSFACLKVTVGTTDLMMHKELMPKYREEQEKTKYVMVFRSMEQLWLAFVMFEKFQKRWDGQDWVKEG